MKYLTLFRHGKSSWKHRELADFDRPLNRRGKRNVPDMAVRFSYFLSAKEVPPPEMIVTSCANRALTTARMLCEGLGYSVDRLQLSEYLYDATIKTIEHVISSLPLAYSHIVLVGHNPGFTWFCNQYTDAAIENIPTSGMVSIEFDVDHWLEIPGHKGKLLWFGYPKNG